MEIRQLSTAPPKLVSGATERRSFDSVGAHSVRPTPHDRRAHAVRPYHSVPGEDDWTPTSGKLYLVSGRTAIFPLMPGEEADTDEDEDQQAVFLDVRGASEHRLDGAAEVVAGGGDDDRPDDAGDGFVDD